MEDHGEAFHLLLQKRLHRLRRHVAAREPRATGGDHDVDARIVDPALHLDADRLDIVGDDGALGDLMTGFCDHGDERIAGFIGRRLARVRYGQDRDAQRREGVVLVELCHGLIARF